jgi:hypothetical protein
MHKGRLQNIVTTLCQMFCGWRLTTSKSRLVTLGSGTLEIDVMTGQCAFEGEPIPQLPIAAELQASLFHNLELEHVPSAVVARARVAAKLSFDQIPWSERSKKAEIHYVRGQPYQSAMVHRCVFDCDSELVVNGTSYRSNMRDVEEWPVGWPE